MSMCSKPSFAVENPLAVNCHSPLSVLRMVMVGSINFMGLPFAGVLRNSQFKAAGNPTQSVKQGV